MSTLALSLDVRDRLALAAAVEQLIAILDDIDGDPDLEDGDNFDDEPWLGASDGAGSRGCWAFRDNANDDREEENEHGGDINDERQDGGDDDEPWLGWSETCSQWRTAPMEGEAIDPIGGADCYETRSRLDIGVENCTCVEVRG